MLGDDCSLLGTWNQTTHSSSITRMDAIIRWRWLYFNLTIYWIFNILLLNIVLWNLLICIRVRLYVYVFFSNSGWANLWENWWVAFWQKILPSITTTKKSFTTPSRSSWKCGMCLIFCIVEYAYCPFTSADGWPFMFVKFLNYLSNAYKFISSVVLVHINFSILAPSSLG